jgi:hypothetical protein
MDGGMESPPLASPPWTTMMCCMPVFLMPVLVQFVEPEQMDQQPPPQEADAEGCSRDQRAEPQEKKTNEKDPEVKKEKPQKPKEWKTPKHVFKPTMVQATPWTLDFAKCNSMHSVFTMLAAASAEDEGFDEAFEELPKVTAKPQTRDKVKARAKEQEKQPNLMKNACSQTEHAILNESSSQTGSYNNLTQFYELEDTLEADETMQATKGKLEAEKAKPETRSAEVRGRRRKKKSWWADQAEQPPAPAAGQVLPDLPELPEFPSADEEEEKEEMQEPAGLPPEAQVPERGKPVLSEEVCFEQFVNFIRQMHTSLLEDDIGDAFDSVAPPGGCLSRAEAIALEQRIQKELKCLGS